jgi:DNA mismatch endonuclease (patch repair protein)
MVDTITPEKRSWVMSRIRSKNTKPEMRVRSLLHMMGYRFRLHRKDLPGKPDIVMTKYKAVIFVHGCFWHHHNKCRDGKLPKSKLDYWEPKIKKNVERDKEHIKDLKFQGWKVFTIWECQTKKTDKLIAEINKIIRKI